MNDHRELLTALDSRFRDLLEEHRGRRTAWSSHELIPWERGRSYTDQPWSKNDMTERSEVSEVLKLNLLTEDNLPSYHHALGELFDPDSAPSEWTCQWSAEEAQHGFALRAYLLVSRTCDPQQLEADRMATMTSGWINPYEGPVELFVYTTMQELATRISHRNAGKAAEDEVCFELMKRIASDENNHYLFYRSAVSAMVDLRPDLVALAVDKVIRNFEMPGTMIPRFRFKAATAALLGVYDTELHVEQVLRPLLREWKIESLTLEGEADEARHRALAYPDVLLESCSGRRRRMNQ